MSTFWFRFSRQWRGFVIEQTLFGPVFRVGWLSFGASKYDPPDFFKEWHSALQKALGRAKGGQQQTGSKGQQS